MVPIPTSSTTNMGFNITTFLALVCIIYSFLPIGLSQHTCISHPVSLSNINQCVDKVCNITTIATFTQKFDGITETCIDFSTANNTAASTLHVIGSKTAATYPLNDCYFSDDPYFNFTMYCSCLAVFCDLPPGVLFCSSQYTEANCPIYNTTKPSVFDNGVVTSTDCLGSLKGHWCSRMLISAYPRYKICRLGIPAYSIIFNIHDENYKTLLSDIYTGVVSDYNVTGLNVTISATLTGATHTGSFILWDKTSLENYYILPSSAVNDINTYNLNKIGWLKVFDNQVYHKLTNKDFDITAKSCQKNQYSLRHNILNTAVYLRNHKEFLGNSINSDRSLIDNEYTPTISDEGAIPNHNLYPYQYIYDGFALYGLDNSVQFFGVIRNETDGTFKISFDPDMTSLTGFPITAIWSGGVSTSTNITVYCLGISYTPQVNPYLNPNYICLAIPADGKSYTLLGCPIRPATSDAAYITSCTPYNGGNMLIKEIRLWPENSIGNIKFNGTFTKLINLDVTGGTFYEYIDSLSAQVTLSYSNISVSFTSSTTKPKIFNCVPFYDSIKFEALSTSNPGSCYAEVQPLGLTNTESIYLSNSINSYTLDIIQESFDGDAMILIRCLRSVVSCNVTLHYATNTTFSAKSDIWTQIGTSLNPINTAVNLYNYADWLAEFIPWDITSILIYLLAITIGLTALLYIIRWAWRNYGPYKRYYKGIKLKDL